MACLSFVLFVAPFWGCAYENFLATGPRPAQDWSLLWSFSQTSEFICISSTVQGLPKTCRRPRITEVALEDRRPWRKTKHWKLHLEIDILEWCNIYRRIVRIHPPLPPSQYRQKLFADNALSQAWLKPPTWISAPFFPSRDAEFVSLHAFAPKSQKLVITQQERPPSIVSVP